jgi:glutaredoxin
MTPLEAQIDMDDRRLGRCACGWEVTGSPDEVVAATMDHAQRVHNMTATRDQVLEQALDIGWLVDTSATQVYGVDTCEDTTRAREHFMAAGHRFRYVDLDAERATRDRLHALGYTATPVVVTTLGAIHVEPDDDALGAIVSAS